MLAFLFVFFAAGGYFIGAQVSPTVGVFGALASLASCAIGRMLAGYASPKGTV